MVVWQWQLVLLDFLLIAQHNSAVGHLLAFAEIPCKNCFYAFNNVFESNMTADYYLEAQWIVENACMIRISDILRIQLIWKVVQSMLRSINLKAGMVDR